MLNKPDWFILKITSFCSAETSHLFHLDVYISILWPNPVLYHVYWQYHDIISSTLEYHDINHCTMVTPQFFSVRACFVRPAVLVPIRVYGKYHFYDDLSALCCVFSTIYSECQNWLFTKNVLECHDQRAAVVETELLIIPLHSTHKNAALPVKSCSDTSLMRNKSHCVAVLSVQYIVSPSQTPNRVLIEEIRHTLEKAVCSIVLYSQVNL